MLEHGINVDSLQRHMTFTTYESGVLFALRFMIDCNIVGGNWVELKAGCYALSEASSAARQTHCQLEAHVHYTNIISHPAEGGIAVDCFYWQVYSPSTWTLPAMMRDCMLQGSG